MATALTSTLFVLLTGVLVAWHMLRAARAEQCATTGAQGPRCPRCATPLVPGALSCIECRVPLSAFEVVAAPVAAPEERDAGPVKLHALVRADVCVGCGACVPVCPEPGAIRLESKRAIINASICQAHGVCAAACPVGGIVLTTGNAVQRVEVPDLDRSFQSNVPGVYVVGELGGRGLIKNAINEGKIAVERIAEELNNKPPASAGMFDVVIVGSGPAGISAGLAAQRAGLRAVLLERGTLADTISKYPRHKLLLAEPVPVPLYGDLWVADASKEDLLRVWEAMVKDSRLDIRTHHEVTRLTPVGTTFEIEAAGQLFVTRRVVLALGRRGAPRRLEVPGEQLPKVLYDIIEMEVFAGRRVLVVGGGDSAVESAVGLAHQPDTDVTLSYRGTDLKRVKERNLVKLQSLVKAGRIRLWLESNVREVREREVVVDVAGRIETLPNDDVIVRIGGEPPVAFLERAGIRMVKKDVPIAPEPAHAQA